MSLFDIIRYGGVNLESFEELQSLPEELIKMYWVLGNRSITPTWNIEYLDHNRMCMYLVGSWGDINNKMLYNKALKEYSNEHI